MNNEKPIVVDSDEFFISNLCLDLDGVLSSLWIYFNTDPPADQVTNRITDLVSMLKQFNFIKEDV